MNVPVLAFPQEVTLEVLPQLQRDADRLIGPTGTKLVVDLSDVMFMSSSALGLLVKVGKGLRDRGGAIALARPQPVIQRMLIAVGLDSVLPVFPTVAEAAASVERRSGGQPPPASPRPGPPTSPKA